MNVILYLDEYFQTSPGTVVNGVNVLDVSALEQSADSSNESSASVSVHQTDNGPEGSDLQPSPHFITVTGKFNNCYLAGQYVHL